MIDLWFVALMLIPSVEVILHSIGYLSRTKLRLYPSTPPSKECWNEILENSKSKGIGHCLKNITTVCNIIMPIFFVIFLATFISTGILLKHNLI